MGPFKLMPALSITQPFCSCHLFLVCPVPSSPLTCSHHCLHNKAHKSLFPRCLPSSNLSHLFSTSSGFNIRNGLYSGFWTLEPLIIFWNKSTFVFTEHPIWHRGPPRFDIIDLKQLLNLFISVNMSLIIWVHKVKIMSLIFFTTTFPCHPLCDLKICFLCSDCTEQGPHECVKSHWDHLPPTSVSKHSGNPFWEPKLHVGTS